MSSKPFSPEENAELEALRRLDEKDIDTTDIPEISDERWMLARKGSLYRPLKQSVTIRLDADVLAWFKAKSEGRRYQTDINSVLRTYVLEQEQQKR